MALSSSVNRLWFCTFSKSHFLRIGENHSGYKILIEEDTDRILGVHVLGLNAEEVINIFALAIRSGLKAEDIKHAIFTYPTKSSDIRYMLWRVAFE